jgi:hypothetical protein
VHEFRALQTGVVASARIIRALRLVLRRRGNPTGDRELSQDDLAAAGPKARGGALPWEQMKRLIQTTCACFIRML